jgi:hypothetical protein
VKKCVRRSDESVQVSSASGLAVSVGKDSSLSSSGVIAVFITFSLVISGEAVSEGSLTLVKSTPLRLSSTIRDTFPPVAVNCSSSSYAHPHPRVEIVPLRSPIVVQHTPCYCPCIIISAPKPVIQQR